MSLERIIGSNSHGFKNEISIISDINDKALSELPTNLKKFIEYICKQENIDVKETDIVNAEKINGQEKADVWIEIHRVKLGVSIKMGSANSVHQEKVESFISWAETETDISELEKNDLRLLIWADGTTDGTARININSKGLVIDRFGSQEFIRRYPDSFNRLNEYFNRNQAKIILRVLFIGKGTKHADFLYKGTLANGSWISKQDYIKYFVDVNSGVSNTRPMCGNLSYQAYNASLKATPSGERKRGDIQFKYSKMGEDLDNYEKLINTMDNMGTREGNIEELNLSKLLNKNKKHKYWKYLQTHLSFDKNLFYYIVKVAGGKYSKNANKKVSCKTDNYIIETRGEINRDFLLSSEYQLTESILPNIGNYQIVCGSGISVKRRNSTSFTITKMALQNFNNALKEYSKFIKFYTAGVVLYSTQSQIHLNTKIAEDIKIDFVEFKDFWESNFEVEIENWLDYRAMSLIKSLAKDNLMQIIDSNTKLKESLFTGKYWFDEPYNINFIYSHGELSKNIYVPYNIDNGSGRSKGKYNIIIKPQ